MQPFDVIAVLIVLTALFSYLNYRFLRLHPSVGVMFIAMVLSLGLILLQKLGLEIRHPVQTLVGDIHFDSVLLRWMLGFLLFAGAMNVDLEELLRQRVPTASLALAGTVASAFIVAGIFYPLFRAAGFQIPMIYCLLLGALISPTDPIAVIALVRNLGAPKEVQTIIAGESLFNDGVAVVLFLTLLNLTRGDSAVTVAGAVRLFFQQSFGGAGLGLIGGWMIYRVMRKTVDFQVEVLLTLALVMGLYSVANRLQVSGPIAVVIAGLMIGNRGHVLKLPKETVEDLSKFWELIEEVLNAILFVMIGLEILVMPFSKWHLIAALAAIPIVLAARWISVAGTLSILQRRNCAADAMVKILTWGGLRGGLAIAMALSLPDGAARQLFVVVTYGVVAFSILVQGTTIGLVVSRVLGHRKLDITPIPPAGETN